MPDRTPKSNYRHAPYVRVDMPPSPPSDPLIGSSAASDTGEREYDGEYQAVLWTPLSERETIYSRQHDVEVPTWTTVTHEALDSDESSTGSEYDMLYSTPNISQEHTPRGMRYAFPASPAADNEYSAGLETETCDSGDSGWDAGSESGSISLRMTQSTEHDGSYEMEHNVTQPAFRDVTPGSVGLVAGIAAIQELEKCSRCRISFAPAWKSGSTCKVCRVGLSRKANKAKPLSSVKPVRTSFVRSYFKILTF